MESEPQKFIFVRRFSGRLVSLCIKVLISPKWVIGDSDRAKKVSKLSFSFFVKRLLMDITGLKEASSLKKCAPVGDWIPGTCLCRLDIRSKLKDQLFLCKKVGMSSSTKNYGDTYIRNRTRLVTVKIGSWDPGL